MRKAQLTPFLVGAADLVELGLSTALAQRIADALPCDWQRSDSPMRSANRRARSWRATRGSRERREVRERCGDKAFLRPDGIRPRYPIAEAARRK